MALQALVVSAVVHRVDGEQPDRGIVGGGGARLVHRFGGVASAGLDGVFLTGLAPIGGAAARLAHGRQRSRSLTPKWPGTPSAIA